nr:NDP-hexose 2,3-dehydratase family protein [Catenovulum sediminis]
MTTEYKNKLEKYISYLEDHNFEVTQLRAETQFESFRDWSVVGDLEMFSSWFLEQQKNCQMTIEDIPLSECNGWNIDPETGWVSHKSGEFFVVQGVRVAFTADREVSGGWDQPILTQVGFDGGLLGLLRKRIDGVPHYLVEAKAEPGNPDKVQISPTLQATFSNLKQAHGGRKPKFSEYFEFPEKNDGTVLFSQWMSEDGGRLHLKRNKGMLVEVPEDTQLEFTGNFYWASLYQLKELIKQNSWVNPHIRGIISHL